MFKKNEKKKQNNIKRKKKNKVTRYDRKKCKI